MKFRSSNLSMQKTSAFSLFLVVCLASAVQSQIIIAPSTINFGDVQIGDSVEKVVYIMNVGDEPVTMLGVGGGANEPFEVVQNCQHIDLQPGEKCMMFFDFKPTTKGPATSYSYGTWNDIPFNISLSANAVEPQITIAPTVIDFGTVKVGDSAERIVYVTNVGDEPVVMKGVGGGLAGPFFYSIQNCQDKTLSSGDSCEMTFTYTPSFGGQAETISSGTWNNVPFNIQVTGATPEILA